MVLCSNRPEGLGPQSKLYPGVTTSCFNDTILLPLGTWLYFILVIVLFVLPRRRNDPIKPKQFLYRTRKYLYAVLLFAIYAMTVLEVTRLELAKLSIGLLPFLWVAFAIAGYLRFTHGMHGRIPLYYVANAFLWFWLLITTGVKIAEEVKEGINTRKGTKYPMVDQITDVSVLIALYFIMLVVELVQ